VVARSSGKTDLALRTRCSSTLSLAGFLPCSSPTVGANVGGIRKSGLDPRTREKGKTDTFSSSTQMTLKETWNLQKTAQASKVVNPLTRALAPPFIGRRREFYISKIPLGPKEYS
jgi:hypothetical protein